MSNSRISNLTQRAKSNWAITIAAGLGSLVLAIVLSSPTSFLNNYGGRVQTRDNKTRYLGHGPLNNQHCWTDPGENKLNDTELLDTLVVL